MAGEFVVTGQNGAAPFTLKLHRGDGMCLLAMNWKVGQPPDDFVGFAIEYKEPGGDRFFVLTNRINFRRQDGSIDPARQSTRISPIQKFRWVHFPRNAELAGPFLYRVTPVFMNAADELSFGEPQEAAVELRRETYPGQLNVSFTRGFVSSQAFVDRYGPAAEIARLLPLSADDGPDFVPTHAKAAEALAWMGFEARQCILEVLQEAIDDPQAQVRVVAYDLSEHDIIAKLEQLQGRLRIIIDDEGSHLKAGSGENQAETRLRLSAGDANIRRQHMGQLQHNKTIVVERPAGKTAICGSTNYSWRGLFVQNNNAIIVQGDAAVQPFIDAFEAYWSHQNQFKGSQSAEWNDLGLAGIDAKITFSPHRQSNSVLKQIADNIKQNATSSVLYSLAFLYQTPGVIRDAIKAVTQDPSIFVYGVSDKKVGGLDVLLPNGKRGTLSPKALGEGTLPAPFSAEPTGFEPAAPGQQMGTRMHHKFVVIDVDKPTARVYMGSYNFSITADGKNGDNLMLIKDRRIATSYAIEALRICDHYHFRVLQADPDLAVKDLALKKPPRKPDEVPWWREDYTEPFRIHDRQIFA